MPVPEAYPPGSPRWWLYRLIDKLLGQQTRYDRLENYHIGQHPLPVVDPKHKVLLKSFMRMAQTNYVTLVNEAPVGRMTVKDFRFGAEGSPDEDAHTIWSVNDMDLQSKKVHTAASIFGDSYVLVGPIDPVVGFPTMTVEDPRVAIVEPHPLYPTKSVAGLRMWEDIYLHKVVAVLYMPDKIYTYIGPSLERTRSEYLTDREMSAALSHGGFDPVAEEDNPLGDVPLIHFEWRPDHNGMSLGESELVLGVQDRINQMVMDRLITAKDQAFAQRFGTGISQVEEKKPGKKNGPQVQAPFVLGSSNFWAVDSPDAKFGQMPAVDFKQMLEAVRDDIADIAAITQTPAHYLMNRFINVSGDTLTQAESGFVAKTKMRMQAMGWGWERAMRVAFRYMSDPKADEAEAAVIWADPQERKAVESADAASKWVAAGVEIGVVMEVLGPFSAEQIEFARVHAEEQQQKDQALLLEQTQASAAVKTADDTNRTS